jgi:hypothetical protein
MWKEVVMALFEVLPQNLLGSSSLALQCCCCKACSEPVHVTASSFQMEMSQQIEKFTGKMEAVAMQENGSIACG